MPGVPGRGGPPPKRESQRRRRNANGAPGGSAAKPIKRGAGEPTVTIPEPNPDWGPIALAWWEALKKSGQSQWYESTDWQLGWTMAETLDREMTERVVHVTKDGTVIRDKLPMSGASLSAFLRGCTALLATEGDRRRAGVELDRPKPDRGGADDGEGEGRVSWLDEARRRSGASA